jgi:hypothetical protein
MSHFLDRLMFLTEHREPFAGGHGETRKEDKIVRLVRINSARV